MPTSDLHLLPGVGHQAVENDLTSFRLRPTERAVWLETDASPDEIRAWEKEAAALGLSVDVWLAIKIEWRVVRGDAPDEELNAVVAEARREAEAARLAPSDELRRWLRFLGRGPQQRAEHDLPSVALPARVVARISPSMLRSSVSAAADEPFDSHALAVERAASLNGMTMEAWCYRTLARLH
jgi:hypothetical protein